MKKKLEKYYPLGYDYRPEIVITALMCVLISAWCFLFYMAELNYGLKLVTQGYRDGVRIIVETAECKVPSFAGELEIFQVFALVLIFALLMAIYRYFYHYQHSKSIYLMKRLPKRSELYKLCLMGGVMISVTGLAFMAGLTVVCFIEYLRQVPADFVRIF